MKKFFAMLLVAAMAMSMVACGTDEETTAADTTAAVETEAPTTEAPTTEAATEAAAVVMSHDEYEAAAVDTEVCVETYVQAKQSWWEDKATLYCQSEDGAYFIYEMPISQEDYDKLVPGTQIRVTGMKSEWSGEVEITEAKYEILDGNYIPEAFDISSILGSGIMINHQNEFCAFNGVQIVAANDEGAAFLYNWDGSGSQGDDLYFTGLRNKAEVSFVVESYLCGQDTDVYKAVEALQVGDVVDMQGFLYWYEGANPHITSLTVVDHIEPETEAPAETTAAAAEGVMTHEEYAAAELDSEVTVETYVQAKQSWWEDKATLYCQSEDGAYFIYDMGISQEDYDKLVPGTKIKVTGFKSEWSGEVEITDAAYEILDDSTFVAEAQDVTELLGTDELIAHQNELVSFTGMTVAAANDDGAAFLYSWDGSGAEGDDLYFNVSINDATYTFTVESYLCGADTDVYKAVQALNVGDVIDMQGFLYWYEGVNPHITSVTVK